MNEQIERNLRSYELPRLVNEHLIKLFNFKKMNAKSQPSALLEHSKLLDRYIVVCPTFFNEAIQQKLDRIDAYIMRDEKKRYRDDPEDAWPDALSADDYCAEIFYYSKHL